MTAIFNKSLRSNALRFSKTSVSALCSRQFSLSVSHFNNQSTTKPSPTETTSPSPSPAKNASISTEGKTVANKQKLYVIDPLSPGSIFFLPHGTRIFSRLIEFMRAQQRCYGFEEVVTPLIYKDDLWKTSGHWEHYKDDMFQVFAESHKETSKEGSEQHGAEHEDAQLYGLKPMNCPGHCVMFSKHEHSFRDLPVRYSDFSPLHRNESSGALSGLTRVRKFHQDDGHIFCEPSQISREITACLKMIEASYSVFGLNEFRLVLSTRPESFAGELSVWETAEANLKQVLDNSGKEWSINPGDGAFYGPKIDILVKDNNGKEHQTATIQLDFQLPKNFKLKYNGSAEQGASKEASESGSASNEHTPVLIHRAIFGSLERFMAILMDHFKGKWPFWLNPRQAIVIPIAERHREYASQIHAQLSGKYNFQYTYPSVASEVCGSTNVGTENGEVAGVSTAASEAAGTTTKAAPEVAGVATEAPAINTDPVVLPALLHSRYFNVDLAASDETFGARTRRSISEGYNYIIAVGDKEMEENKLSIRTRDSRETITMTTNEVLSMFSTLEDAYQ